MANVLLLNGSPHAHGVIDLALTEVAQTLQECGLTTEIVHIGQQDIRGCIACGRCGVLHHCVFDDAVNALAPKFEAAGVDMPYPLLKDICETIVRRYVEKFIE